MTKLLDPILIERGGLQFLPDLKTRYLDIQLYDHDDVWSCPDCKADCPPIAHGQVLECDCGETWVLYGVSLQKVLSSLAGKYKSA